MSSPSQRGGGVCPLCGGGGECPSQRGGGEYPWDGGGVSTMYGRLFVT